MYPINIFVTLLFLVCDIALSSDDNDLFVTNLVYMNDSFNNPTYHTDSFTTDVKGEKRGFAAYLEVGSEGFGQYLFMDTGSSFTWIYCDPFEGHAPIPIFNPSQSTSFKAENCLTSKFCLSGRTGTVYTKCTPERKCSYEQKFWGIVKNVGYLAKDTISFVKEKKSALRNIVLGCSQATNLYASTNLNVNGVMGLGTNSLSLLSQSSSTKFSYCIGNINDLNYQYNKLLIGNNIKLLDSQTPLIIQGDKYYINLESITFDGEKLEIDSKIFQRNSDASSGGMLIDSSATLSFLPELAVDMLREEIGKRAAALDLIPNYSIIWSGHGEAYSHERMCFNGKLDDYEVTFPPISLRFVNQADLLLVPYNYFNQVNDQVFCVSIIPTEALGSEFSIMGAYMQQFSYIVFDVKAKIVSFEAMDCVDMDDYIHDELRYNN